MAGRQAKMFCPKICHRSQKSRHIGLECQGNASSLHLPPQSVPHHWSGATAAKLEGLLKHSVQIYVWIFENGDHVRTATLTVFQEITEVSCSK